MAVVGAVAATAMLGAPAHAQNVVVQGQGGVVVPGAGQAQVQGQVQVGVQPPPGYEYARPAPAQPQYGYAPSYPVRQPQLRYEQREQSIKGLWIPGIIIFAASYGLTAAFGGALSFNDDYLIWTSIPLIGPWVALGYAGSDGETAGAVLGGVTQAAGALMFVLGLSLTRTVRVPVYAFDRFDPQSPRLGLDVIPAPGGFALGASLAHF